MKTPTHRGTGNAGAWITSLGGEQFKHLPRAGASFNKNPKAMRAGGAA